MRRAAAVRAGEATANDDGARSAPAAAAVVRTVARASRRHLLSGRTVGRLTLSTRRVRIAATLRSATVEVVAPRARADAFRGGVQAAARAEAALTSERKSTSPSVEPNNAALARSGWGMSPTTLPASLAIPAMASTEPLGLSA